MSDKYFEGDDGNFSSEPKYIQGISDEELKALEAERTVFEETEVQMGQRLMRNALIGAVQSLNKLALYSTNERIRLTASQYIIERNMGRVQDNPPAAHDDPFADLLADCVTDIAEPEALAAIVANASDGAQNVDEYPLSGPADNDTTE